MNDLESALAKAATDPASRPQFYRLLLESDIYVIGSTNTPGDGSQVISAGDSLALVKWKKRDGTEIIPFFASLEALQHALAEPTAYLALPARAFFDVTRGATLVLNPSSEHGKEFFPQEIEALLETGVNSAPTVRKVTESTRVLLGQPANYPTAMVKALSRLLTKHGAVKAAYLCQMHDPSSGEKPSLVVGLEGEGDLVAVIQEVGAVAADTAPPGQPVDFLAIERGEEGLAAYLLDSVTPFYQQGLEATNPKASGSGGYRPGWAFMVTALILGMCYRALIPQIPNYIVLPVIVCMLMAFVAFDARRQTPLPVQD